MKHFRIRDLGEGRKPRFLVEERHTVLFFLRYWDFGSSSLYPNNLYDSPVKAALAVILWCRLNHRKYKIVKYEKRRIECKVCGLHA